MKNKVLSILSIIVLTIITSCYKTPSMELLSNNMISDKDKIDIKGTLMNGDMKHPNIAVYYIGKTLYVYFHDYLGVCTICISNMQDSVYYYKEDTPAYLNAEARFYMGDLPLQRYHLTISDGTNMAEGWFNNFQIVPHRELQQPHGE